MPLDRYMQLCLGHPRHGYYMTRDPFGAEGDFTTAPEISQMFGELIGLWAAEVWRIMGRPSRVNLVELGPGRGTLMADALRAARVLPAFRAAMDVHLVETSDPLRERQRVRLRDVGLSPRWHASVETLPDGPLVIIANEFFDALAVRQFVRTQHGWCERFVGLGADGGFAFGLAPWPDPAIGAAAPVGTILEIGGAGLALMTVLSRRIAGHGGALLVVDYGHARSGFGETLQAVKGHAFVDPLAEPGEADLTAHVDFAALAGAATGAAAVHGPVAQGAFLEALGIARRAETLGRKAGDAGRAAVGAALARLTGRGEGGMGSLFKAMAVADPGLPLLPGFDTRTMPGDTSCPSTRATIR